MPEYKVSCPSCGQHIQVTEAYAGVQIPCPSCQKAMTVPASPGAAAPAAAVAASAPASAAPARKSSLRTAPPQSTPASAAAPTSSPGQPASASAAGPARKRRIQQREDKQRKMRSVMTVVAGVVILAVALMIAWPMLKRWQAGLNEAREESGPGMVGGQVSHIAELNTVLDATDPSNFTPGSQSGTEYEVLARAQSLGNLPLASATWSLELPSGALPRGRANGRVGGGDFVVDAASLITGGSAPLLTLRQENGPELLIYLRTSRGESLEGQTFRVTKADARPAAQVIRRGQAGAQQARFAKGFALRLELGRNQNGTVPGQLFLALPDPEKSVVAGVFNASVTAAQPGAQPQETAPARPPARGSPQLPPELGAPRLPRFTQ